MTFAEFKQKYLGRLIDYDGHYGGQCFDVANQYILDITGKKPLITLLKASDIYKRPQGIIPASVQYQKIQNTIEAIPKQGDIIVWDDRNWNLNYGHVAIVDTADSNGAWVIQQDGLNPTQGVKSVYWNFHKHNPIGWLRLINNQSNNNQQEDMNNLFTELLNSIKRLQATRPTAYDNWGRANGNSDMAKQGKESLVWINEMVDQLFWRIESKDFEIQKLKEQNAIIHREDKPETLARLDQLTLANAELTKQMQQLAEENKALNEEINKTKPSLNEEIKNEVYPQFNFFLNWVKNNIATITSVLGGLGIVTTQDAILQIVSLIVALSGYITAFCLEYIKNKNK